MLAVRRVLILVLVLRPNGRHGTRVVLVCWRAAYLHLEPRLYLACISPLSRLHLASLSASRAAVLLPPKARPERRPSGPPQEETLCAAGFISAARSQHRSQAQGATPASVADVPRERRRSVAGVSRECRGRGVRRPQVRRRCVGSQMYSDMSSSSSLELMKCWCHSSASCQRAAGSTGTLLPVSLASCRAVSACSSDWAHTALPYWPTEPREYA
uniref:Secreted protein n=1 Tax=Calcidiscus leptoporus TaxID=127549 RepID=A0A7S0J3L1_9EUKA|mmetsp:Transcript_36294/g.84782  ORF Transcript_36294/g.84782 Transcript_36294/m.84782 type:complete len:214 (+) Transcript_36294:303-944(+)